MTTDYIDVLKLSSQEAEEAVIGSILISGSQFVRLQGFLRAGDFWTVRYQTIWKAFERLTEEGSPIELTTVYLDIEKMGMLHDIGGPAELTRLCNIPSNSMHVDAYARHVHRLATHRAMLEASDELRKNATEGANIDLAIARSERAIMGLRRRQMSVDIPLQGMQEATLNKFKALTEAEARTKENPDYIIGVRTGLADLDFMLDGLRPGVTTLAAATGMGKTALCLQIVRFAAKFGILRGYGAQPAKTLFFSGEMTQDQLMNRLLGSMTGVPIRHIERGSYNAQQKERLIDALGELDMNHCLSFENAKRMNTGQIRQRVQTMVAENDLDFLALDGLLQIESLAVSDYDSAKQKAYMDSKRRDAIEAIMNDLEDISLTREIPILLTHQLSRAPSGRADKRPVLSDLAEANFVEQKSAVILFLYRDSYYNDEAQENSAEVICQKNRHGQTGTVHQIYDAQYTRFIDADHSRFTLGGD
jgi:replicative DNA helicase